MVTEPTPEPSGNPFNNSKFNCASYPYIEYFINIQRISFMSRLVLPHRQLEKTNVLLLLQLVIHSPLVIFAPARSRIRLRTSCYGLSQDDLVLSMELLEQFRT